MKILKRSYTHRAQLVRVSTIDMSIRETGGVGANKMQTLRPQDRMTVTQVTPNQTTVLPTYDVSLKESNIGWRSTLRTRIDLAVGLPLTRNLICSMSDVV